MKPPSAWTMETIMSAVMQAAARLEAAGTTDREDLFTALRDETPDLQRIMVRLVRTIDEAEADVAALRSRVADLDIRRQRAERVRDECRATLFSVMDVLGLKKWLHPEATVSVVAGKPQARVIDHLLLPSEYATTVVKPDMAKINKAIAAGEEVPGVEVSNGSPSLTIRTK